MSRTPQPCGTEAAYQRHWRARETPCTDCLEAHAAVGRASRVGSYVRGPYGRDKPKCGTRRGYRRHVLRGEVTCIECCRAESAYRRELTARRTAKQAAA
jgi:hypothetical protein